MHIAPVFVLAACIAAPIDLSAVLQYPSKTRRPSGHLQSLGSGGGVDKAPHDRSTDKFYFSKILPSQFLLQYLATNFV